MAYKMVVCPESARPEMIEYEEHPLGILTRGCSRFRPACELACSRACAVEVELDRRRPSDEIEPGDETITRR